MPRDEQGLSTTERLIAIAEILARGVHRWLAVRPRAPSVGAGREDRSSVHDRYQG
jgi:hypothetical protein